MISIIFLVLLVIVLSGITTIPFSIALLAVLTVLLKKNWIFFIAFGLGLYLDLISINHLGYTGLMFAIFVFLIRLYERKFETQTIAFVLISTFLGSIFYLWLFGYQMVFLQAIINALVAVVFFRVILSKAKDLDSSSLHSSE